MIIFLIINVVVFTSRDSSVAYSFVVYSEFPKVLEGLEFCHAVLQTRLAGVRQHMNTPQALKPQLLSTSDAERSVSTDCSVK